MVYVRKSVWANGGDFNDPILYWYAMGVGALKQKGLNEKTSWRFIAAIHGFDASIWKSDGYYTPGEVMPSPADQALYWNQCQHQTWYFLPWHRGYIWSIETLVRNEIIKQGGPNDWAMPYWNYSDPHNNNARLLPPAFSRTTLPNGSPNPLYVSQRHGTGAPHVVLPANDVTLGALTIAYFTGSGTGSLTGFGGVKTGFSHSGTAQGQLESKPHNIVHVDIGGRGGLMSDPVTAGLDPIFWLHHANIDRLWAVWNASNTAHTDPTDAAWLNGPLNRKFVVPDAAGNAYTYTPSQTQVTTNAPWNYTYDQIVAANAALALSAPLVSGTRTVSDSEDTELLSTNASALAVTGSGASDVLRLDESISPPAIDFSPRAMALRAAAPPPRHLYLNLKNIRAASDGTVIDVYLNLPADAGHEGRPDRLAGSFALFGARSASLKDAEHGGLGVSEVFDVTELVARIGHSGELGDGKQLSVHLVPRDESADAAKITVEQISLYRA